MFDFGDVGNTRLGTRSMRSACDVVLTGKACKNSLKFCSNGGSHPRIHKKLGINAVQGHQALYVWLDRSDLLTLRRSPARGPAPAKGARHRRRRAGLPRSGSAAGAAAATRVVMVQLMAAAAAAESGLAAPATAGAARCMHGTMRRRRSSGDSRRCPRAW